MVLDKLKQMLKQPKLSTAARDILGGEGEHLEAALTSAEGEFVWFVKAAVL